MMKLVVAVLAILMILPVCAFAQATGKIVGVVTDSKTNEPLAGANVLIEGTYSNELEMDKFSSDWNKDIFGKILEILKLLRGHDDLTVDDLASHLEVTVPTVSRHLQLLRMQNLVTFNQDAQTRYYQVNEEEIVRRVTAFLQDLDITLPDG